jgi:hypothetical protein
MSRERALFGRQKILDYNRARKDTPVTQKTAPGVFTNLHLFLTGFTFGVLTRQRREAPAHLDES